MNIFLICNKSPYPPKEGGPIAMNAMVKGLVRAGHTVKVLAINTNKYFIDLKDVPEHYREKTKLETVYVNLSIKPVDAFLNLFTTKSYHVERFITRELDEKIKEILQNEKFDIVQLETLYVAPYVDTIRKYSNAKIVLRAHNIEHLIWERIAGNCKNPVKRFYLNPEFPSLFHLGSMNWVPNQEGIRWFLEHVWPPVNKMFPDLKFWLAGRMMPDWLLNAHYPGVEIVGEVDSASDFIQSKMVMIVPLFSGSGIRIKIIEGMALKRPVISTAIGAEGINCLSGKNIMIADTAEEYIQWIRQCVEDKQFCNDIGDKARTLIENEHNNDKIIDRLTKFYHKIT